MKEQVEILTKMYETSPVPTAILHGDLSVYWANESALSRYKGLALPSGLLLLLPSTVAQELLQNPRPMVIELSVLHSTATIHPVEGGFLVQLLASQNEPADKTDAQSSNMLVSLLASHLRGPVFNVFLEASAVARVAISDRLATDDDSVRLLTAATDINKSCYALLRLTGNATTYMQQVNGPVLDTSAYIDLNATVENLAKAAQIQVSTAGIRLSYSLPNAPVVIKADGDKLTQALLHIIANSCRFTREGNHIELSLDKADSTAVITISDRGTGIPANLCQKVFEPFFSYDPHGMPYAGVGLGLTLARLLVIGEGGSLALTSIEGESTTIAISLPLFQKGNGLILKSTSSASDLFMDRFSSLHITLSDTCTVPRP